MNRRTLSLLGVAAAATTALLIAGCSSTPPPPNEIAAHDAAPEGTAEAPQGTAAQFVACLNTAGLQARIGEDGYVLVKVNADSTGGDMSIGSESGSTGEQPLLLAGDSDGNTWVAAASSAYFADDPTTHDAYAGCEAQLPDFAQPEADPQNDPDTQEYIAQQAEDALTFARCARDAGFAWVADPTGEPGTSPAIALPSEVTEEEFRALLQACFTPDAGVVWAIPDDLPFDWMAVLDEFSAGGSGGGS